MFNNVINLPFLFLFLPLIFSGINATQNFEFTNTIINIFVLMFLIGLSFFLIPQVIQNGFIKYESVNSVFMFSSYYITLTSLIFIILVFFLKIITFLVYHDKDTKMEKKNIFYSLYLINYYNVSTIFIEDNIINIYLAMELYTITISNIIDNYVKKDIIDIGYNYFIENTIGSILLLFFTFIVYFTFGTSKLSFIVENLSTTNNSIFFYSSIILLIFGIYFKFFSFNFYFSKIIKSKNIDNTFFIHALFINPVIGFCILKKLISVYDIALLNTFFHFRTICFIIGSFIVIYNSYKLYARKNLLWEIYNSCIILTGYLIILIALNNQYSIISSVSFIINHIFVDFLFYIIVSLIAFYYKKTDTIFLYFFKKYRYIVYMLLLIKIGFPVGFGFSANWNLLLSIIDEKEYYLFIPFLIEKISLINFLYKTNYSFTQEKKGELKYIIDNTNIYKNNNYMLIIIILVIVLLMMSIILNSLPKGKLV
jgi:formate hydrogenlyase subunit 3/multisubunit Na+/H+ antiporter MnhD subunit